MEEPWPRFRADAHRRRSPKSYPLAILPCLLGRCIFFSLSGVCVNKMYCQLFKTRRLSQTKRDACFWFLFKGNKRDISPISQTVISHRAGSSCFFYGQCWFSLTQTPLIPVAWLIKMCSANRWVSLSLLPEDISSENSLTPMT